MAVVELDPVFVKALKYLHSKSQDSSDKLKKLLDDAIAQRKGQKVEIKLSSKALQKQQQEDQAKKHEAEKRTFDKLKQDLSGLSEEVPVKKARLETSQSSSPVTIKDEAMEVEVKLEEKTSKEGREKGKKESDKKSSKDSTESSNNQEESKSFNADDFAFGLGIACVICNRFDVSSGNQLVECQECHTLYHQECHKPTVTEQDVNDPRFVWYCSKCTKTMKKMVKTSSKNKTWSGTVAKESTSPSAVNVSSTTTPTPTSASSKSSDSSTMFSFRRVDNKPTSTKDTSSSSGNRPLSGLASLAANLSGKVDTSKPGHTRSESAKFALNRSESIEQGKQSHSKSDLSKSGRSDSMESLKSGHIKSETSKSGVSRSEFTESSKSGHARSESSKSGMSRSDSSKSLHKEKIKQEATDKVSIIKSSKSQDSSKSSAGGIRFGVDIFKGLKSSDQARPKASDVSKSASKSSEQIKSSSKSTEGVKSKSSEGIKPSESGKSKSSESIKTSDSSKSKSSEPNKAADYGKKPSDANKCNFKSLPDMMKLSSRSSSEKSRLDQSKSSCKASVSSSSSKQQGGTSSVVNADKRLQMMKKKAAAKLHEKRSSLK